MRCAAKGLSRGLIVDGLDSREQHFLAAGRDGDLEGFGIVPGLEVQFKVPDQRNELAGKRVRRFGKFDGEGSGVAGLWLSKGNALDDFNIGRSFALGGPNKVQFGFPYIDCFATAFNMQIGSYMQMVLLGTLLILAVIVDQIRYRLLIGAS